MTAEFYIHAHESDENATIADEAYGTKIGYFEDKLFDAEGKSCNSYACCDPDAPSRTVYAALHAQSIHQMQPLKCIVECRSKVSNNGV